MGLPQLQQNLPVLEVPQLHTQLAAAGAGAGLGLPQFAQNLPVLPVWPQLQVQPAGAEAGAGAGCAAACCWAPIWYRFWAFIPPAAPAIFMPMNAIAGPAFAFAAADFIASACACTSEPAARVGSR